MSDCGFCDGSGKIQIYTQSTQDWIDPNDWQTILSLRHYEHLRSVEDLVDFAKEIERAVNGSGEINCPACKR